MTTSRRRFLAMVGAGAAMAAGAPLAAETAIRRIAFLPVGSIADVEQALKQAGCRRTLLWFRADWDVGSIELSQTTFADQKVIAALADTRCLVVDVTDDSDDDKALMEHFGIFGPPTFVLFDKKGRRLDENIVGYLPPEKFVVRIEEAFGN
ncbi:MAG: thioredoxin fold domain-containing protein [Woeseiaceae bacterium]|nr:thioredoxin fold domain-containing protein [Woeseiaceae bacterium]